MVPRIYLNVGCGRRGTGGSLPYFSDWQEVRLDLDPLARPDVVANITDLDCIADASFDAVFSSHSIEHLFEHELPRAMQSFRRILKPEGFACILVPDLQIAARAIAEDRMSDPIYHSVSGPISAHDMVFGFGAAIARGSVFMAHRCGFTPTVLGRTVVGGGFAEVIVRRREAHLELAAVGLKATPSSPQARAEFMESLGL